MLLTQLAEVNYLISQLLRVILMFHISVFIIAFTAALRNQTFQMATNALLILKKLLSVAILINLITLDFLRSESFCVVLQTTSLHRLGPPDPNNPNDSPPCVGNHWVSRFLKRHPEYKVTRQKTLDLERKRAEGYKALEESRTCVMS